MSYRSRLAAIVLTLAVAPAPAGAVAIRVPPPAGSSEAGFGLDAYAQLSATDGNVPMARRTEWLKKRFASVDGGGGGNGFRRIQLGWGEWGKRGQTCLAV